jgi:PhnB protein
MVPAQHQYLPPGYHSVNPYFVVADVDEFVHFLTSVFAGVEHGEREVAEDGSIGHADVMVGDSLIMMSAASAKYPPRPAVSFAYVEDVDAVYLRAIQFGCTTVQPPADQAWGDRVGGVVDPFDNRWWIATRL